jgi:hypothetical protein
VRFTIKKTSHDYVVIRIGGEYSQHAHFHRASGARKIIELLIHNKMPTKRYFVKAAKRLLTDEEFEKLQGCKKQKYYNQSRRVI